ncbi:MAG: glutamate formimidoyltransferase [Candidatus Aminicenantes bacterium RBG_19FT_COMBO_59_29]|nr:MAG: glutamate formimidoyltransferase [Candidatus Aminicenantes bacterium RBG_19FT_COMBO_59_29]
MKLVECVPNFSEGRDREKIKAITQEIERTPEVRLLDVDPGESTNRTVVTFIGSPEGVEEAAFRAIRKAAELIDMRQQKGAHSRIGATDVCPFVPVSGVTMEDCVLLARNLGKRVARELGIPVYLYEEAAQKPERRNLANIRAGEYEGLAEKLKDPRWAPDFGDPVFNPTAGATVIGAREFLIAYNINLNTRDRRLAHEISLRLRESGRAQRDAQGNVVRDAQGKAVTLPGRFPHVKAVGWYIEDYGVAQISINFTNYKITPVHLVFDEAAKEAEKLGLRVTGSELVGLIPKEALLMAGRYYLEKQGKSPGVPEEELVRTAVHSLGLGDVAPFDPDKKIIENQFREDGPSLLKLNLREFASAVSLDCPTPGGGSVAALCAALSASLSAMVANLTFGKKGYEEVSGEMKDTASKAQKLKEDLLTAVDEDTRAFNKVMEAFGLPKGSEEQTKEKEAAIESATKQATLVPLGVLERCVPLLELAMLAAQKGNRNSLSDAGVAGLIGEAAAIGAFYNVKINLPGIRDDIFRDEALKKGGELMSQVTRLGREIRALVERQLDKT